MDEAEVRKLLEQSGSLRLLAELLKYGRIVLLIKNGRIDTVDIERRVKLAS